MIRQAINCDICAAEKLASNYWFVAYEQGGELKLRGWESPQNSRKNVKHLCGQKCAQRLVANFMASVMSTTTHGAEQGKEDAEAGEEGFVVEAAVEPVKIAARAERGVRVRERSERAERTERSERSDRSDRTDRTDRSLLSAVAVERVEIDGEWVGPVRYKEDPWEPAARVMVDGSGRGRMQRPA